MKRIGLFLLTNLAVVFVLGIVAQVLGVDRWLTSNGLNLGALLVFSALFGFGGAFVSLAMSKWMAKRSTGAHVITEPRDATERWLLDTVHRQAKAAGIGLPEVAIYDAPDINAFATGMSRNNALVAVSTGLLRSMTKDEAEAVLGHEVSHVANGDMVTLTLIQGVVNTFVIFLSRIVGYVVDRVILKNDRGHGIGFFVSSMIAQVLLGILASVIVMWFSRRREFRADAGGAQLAGRQKMIAALERLKSGQPSSLPDGMQAMGIATEAKEGLKALFLSHPPLDQRIAALRAAGG
ncbi:MAG: protease HtpX [Burkholderiales bacterium]|nr:protease HtpX [Burkholderiales bacterium]